MREYLCMCGSRSAVAEEERAMALDSVLPTNCLKKQHKALSYRNERECNG